MANQTVYPYGTGGSLPASVGIVNDMTTGGADKALSAQQGKVIGDYLFSKYVAKDLSGITLSNYSLGSGSSSNNKWTQNGKHKVIPVTPGDKIKVAVSSTQTNGGYYGFLTSSYVVPTSTSDTVPYVSGTFRVWLNASSSPVELTVPATAAYLCICPKDGDSHESTWVVSDYVEAEIDDDFVNEDSDILNPLVPETVDISSIEEKSLTMLSNGNWGAGASGQGKHIVVPVVAGDKIQLFASSEGGGNFYAFLTSSYTTPSAGNSIPYVAGTSRVFFYDYNSGNIVTAPTNAAYLCLVVVNGDGYRTAWRAKKYVKKPVNDVIEDYALMKADVVNDLTTGGTEAPLSAEQGKVLGEKVGDPIPPELTKYDYIGPGYKFNDARKVAYKTIMTVSGNTSPHAQGGDCFGNWFFQFVTENSVVRVYNLSSKTLVQTATIESEDRGFVSNCHGNSACFGLQRYDDDDEFPLIYVSTGYNDGTHSGCLVYRIQRTEESDVSTFTFTLVQTIKFPGTAWTEFVTADECLLVCDTSARTIYRFNMPLLSSGDVTLDTANALDVYQFTPQPSSFNGSQNQGRLYHDGKMFVASGVPSRSQKSFLMVLNLSLGIRETVIDFTDMGLTAESESVFIWQNHLCVAFMDKIVMFYFD